MVVPTIRAMATGVVLVAIVLVVAAQTLAQSGPYVATQPTVAPLVNASAPLCGLHEERDDVCATCEGCPPRGTVLFAGVDSWRGRPDGDFSNNNGAVSGVNFGTRLGRVSDWTGAGLQLGASYGLYDWSGRSSNAISESGAQQQVYVTAGLFRRINDGSDWSFGLVHDWQVNRHLGTYGTNPTLGQWRGQIAYATNAWNEYGVWATLRDASMMRNSQQPLVGNVEYRAINQANVFWHHKYLQGADSWLWIGLPQRTRLGAVGSLGDVLVGGTGSVPISDYASLYVNLQYLHPTASPGPAAASEETWNLGFGLAYYLGGFARTNTVAGNCWLPLMPVANNGNFLVDSSAAQ